MFVHRTTKYIISIILTGLFCVTASAQQVTIVITHGYSLDGSKGSWIEAMGNAMLVRASGGGAICRYDQTTGAWRLVSGTIDAQQPIVLIYRWLQDFDKQGTSWGYLEGAADALYAGLHDARFIDSGGQPLAGFDLINNRFLHLLGHSRGGCVNSETCERFAVAGVTVDHVTSMDPHPVNGTLDPPFSNQNWGDPVPKRWNNIIFQDNYWRADGGGFINGFDFDGIPIPTAHNYLLDENALNCCAYSFAHSDTHLWYHGTIDLGPTANDGDQSINATMRNTWWQPIGEANTGFLYSRIGGGVAQRPVIPAGETPGVVPVLYGGTFENNTYAGWLYHGGAVSGTVSTVNGRTSMRLGAGTGNSARHNRMLLPQDIRRLRFEYNIVTADTVAQDDVLRVTFTDRSGTNYVLPETLALTAVTGGWTAAADLNVPITIPRNLVYTISFDVVGGTINATVALDDIALLPKVADLDHNGVVDVFDLFVLLGNWGACDVPCPPSCSGDVTDSSGAEPDCTVDVFDLFVLLAQWG